ncbi:MAG: hypothetical protein ACLFR8_07095 [Alkalispirochaeta sp.]
MPNHTKQKSIAIAVTLSLLLIFAGCANPSGSNESDSNENDDSNPVAYLPVLAPGNSISGSGINAQAVTDDADTAANVRFYASAPLVYSFAENSLGVGTGDTYVSTNDVFGAVTFTVTESNGVVTYTGENSDRSIRVTATYNSDTKKIGYEQILYLDDQGKKLNDSTAMKLVVYTKFSDITLTDDGSFVGPIEAVVLYDSDDGLGFQATSGGNAEVFHGKIDGTSIGTGYAIGKGVSSADDSTPFPEGTGKPTTATDLANLDDMYTYITGVTPAKFVSDAGGSTENGAIFWRVGTDPAQQDQADPATFPPDFTGNGLTGWANVTSLTAD